MTNCENFKIVSNNSQSQSTNSSESGTGLPPISNRRNNDKDQYFGLDTFFNENATFFKDVYIYGKLYYEFESNIIEIFDEVEIRGNATFLSDVNLVGNINAGIITARKRLDVGCGGTTLNVDVDTGKIGIANVDPITTLDVNGDAHISDKLGIGSNIPQQRIDVAGSIKIDENIYDSVNSPGLNGFYLSMDEAGIRWTASEPSFTEGIFVQDEGVYIPTTGIAQSFTTLNFKQINSLGKGTDTIIPIPNPDNPTFIADIQSQDLWGFTGGEDIYRMTKVGIQNNNPSFTLDITGTLHATEEVEFDSTLDVGGATTLNDTLDVDGATTLNNTLDVDGATTLNNTLDVDLQSVFHGTIELDSSLIDVNGEIAGPSVGKTDYRLASVGTGVSWRPPGVETQNTIWVTKDGNDLNTGFLEGDAKATIGSAAEVAQSGDTIVIRPGLYIENNPIGLRTDVTVTGQDLRLVTVTPINTDKDVFHVRRGCLIENINFAGSSVLIDHTGCAAIAFPPTNPSNQANSGYIALGPANEGPSLRWRSPYIRNCTNFMTGSIGMKIDGDHAIANFSGTNNIGNDLKCMVCDSFTQYNENGIGVSITNNGYAQLVSIFTINSNIGIYCDTGGSCDLTNSNSSFGNYGLYAVGLGATEYTGTVSKYPPTRINPGVDAESDVVTFDSVYDEDNNPRRPYDGQALFFQIKNPGRSRYPDADPFTLLESPMLQIQEIKVGSGGTGFSALNPPTVIIRDSEDFSQVPKGPQGIIAELSATIDEVTGSITAIDVVNSGRNYLPTQNLEVFIDGGDVVGASAEVITQPIYYAVDVATENTSGITTVTFTDFIPYELFGDEDVSFKRISRILTSSHSFEYIGTGVDINTSTPFKGAVPIKENEIVALDGAQIPFTSTDQKGNFDIGEGFQINQPTSTIRGRDFSKAIQAEVTPLILALR